MRIIIDKRLKDVYCIRCGALVSILSSLINVTPILCIEIDIFDCKMSMCLQIMLFSPTTLHHVACSDEYMKILNNTDGEHVDSALLVSFSELYHDLSL